eukprot:TRINITY_DN999_c1_g1_i1.p1 TRINITY_DN999_c1_g1~~TRINITY_DN999_c1_g1_i1.p1  ORF type:complete len:254 (-),score=44.75 TRINITY_DN999_c1_g1_i1:75-776(-)
MSLFAGTRSGANLSSGKEELMHTKAVLDDLEARVIYLEKMKRMRPPPGHLSPANSPRLFMKPAANGGPASTTTPSSSSSSSSSSESTEDTTASTTTPTDNGTEPQDTTTTTTPQDTDSKAGQEPVETPSESSEPGSVLFGVKSNTQPGTQVYVTGSSDELGNWDPKRALKLATDKATYPLWQGTLTAPVGSEQTYKIFKMRHSDESSIQWFDNGTEHPYTTPAGKSEVLHEWM